MKEKTKDLSIPLSSDSDHLAPGESSELEDLDESISENDSIKSFNEEANYFFVGHLLYFIYQK